MYGDNAQDAPATQAMLEMAGVGHWVYSQDPGDGFASPTCWTLLGAPADKTGSFADWCQRAGGAEQFASWETFSGFASAQEGAQFELELPFARFDGGEVWLRVSGRVAKRDPQGLPTQLEGVVAEAPAMARSQLASAQERFDVIANGASAGLWDLDISTGASFWSARMYEATGLNDDGQEPSSELFTSHIHPADRERVHAALQAHLAEREPYELEFRFSGDDGQLRWLHAKAQALWNAQGEPVRIAGSVENITKAKQAELALESERIFQDLVFSTIDDLLFVKDEQFRIVQANAAFLNLYPADIRDDVIGSTTLEEYDEEQRKVFLVEDQRALDEGFSVVQETIDFPSGRQRTLWTKKIRFEDAHGARYVLGFGRDITELKEAERALTTANAELEEFAYRISHDLRSPLQSSVRLLGYLQAAIEKGDLEESGMVLGTVQTSLQTLDELARDVLDLQRIQHGQSQPEVVDMQQAVAKVWARHQIEEDQITLSEDYQLGVQPVVDLYGLNLVLDNLISNAVKYRDAECAGSRIALSVRSEKRYLTIMVEDNGIGIPEAKRQQIFGMFQRFHPRKSFGSGLGLYMTQQWAARMGGSVVVEHLEAGTRFVVKVPQQQLVQE